MRHITTIHRFHTFLTQLEYLNSLYSMNSLCSGHSHGYHNRVPVVVASQPTVTGGTLVGLYNFNSTVNTIPTIGNGIAPSWRTGTGSISSTTYHNGTGSLSSTNSAENQLYLGAYTFTNNNQFSVAFWFYPIRTTMTNNVGSYNICTSSTPANQYIVVVQNFMQFGYFLLDKWCEGTVEANTTKFLDLLRVYNTVEEQTELYQLFLNNVDDIGSTLKNMVRDRKKALTKNAPHKSRTKKVVDTATRENDVPKKRRGKDKVVKFVSAEQKLIDELIRLANERVA